MPEEQYPVETSKQKIVQHSDVVKHACSVRHADIVNMSGGVVNAGQVKNLDYNEVDKTVLRALYQFKGAIKASEVAGLTSIATADVYLITEQGVINGAQNRLFVDEGDYIKYNGNYFEKVTDFASLVLPKNSAQTRLTFDPTPIVNSKNPVESGGVKSYVDAIKVYIQLYSSPDYTTLKQHYDSGAVCFISNGSKLMPCLKYNGTDFIIDIETYSPTSIKHKQMTLGSSNTWTIIGTENTYIAIPTPSTSGTLYLKSVDGVLTWSNS